MVEDLLTVLTRFHREIVLPDIDRVLERVDVIDGRTRLILSHLDAIYIRFDRLESEYHALSAAVARIEERM